MDGALQRMPETNVINLIRDWMGWNGTALTLLYSNLIICVLWGFLSRLSVASQKPFVKGERGILITFYCYCMLLLNNCNE